MLKSIVNSTLSLSSSSVSLTLSSPDPADGCLVPTDGSISTAPADGVAGIGGDSSGEPGTAALCSEFCCCHDAEIVVFRFKKREIDKTHIISDPSVAVSCCIFHIADTCSAKIGKLQELSGFDLSSFSGCSGEGFVGDRMLITETNNCIFKETALNTHAAVASHALRSEER